jgi:hypothetical protein
MEVERTANDPAIWAATEMNLWDRQATVFVSLALAALVQVHLLDLNRLDRSLHFLFSYPLASLPLDACHSKLIRS